MLAIRFGSFHRFDGYRLLDGVFWKKWFEMVGERGRLHDRVEKFKLGLVFPGPI